MNPGILFLLSCTWTAVSLAAGRLAGTLVPMAWVNIGSELVTLAMLVLGFLFLVRLRSSDTRLLSDIGIVRRPTAGEEFGRGLALGWGIALALVLPALLSGYLTLTFTLSPQTWRDLATSLLVLSLFAGVVQLVLAGLPVRSLLRTAGPGWTLTAAMLLAWLLSIIVGSEGAASTAVTVIAVGICVTGALRTRALWLSLGVQLGWAVSQQLLFGAQLSRSPVTAGVVQNTTFGPAWLTGFTGHPESSAIAPLVLAAAYLVLFRITRTYAWHYTYDSPDSGGVPVVVAPPPAHAAHVPAAPSNGLIQIGSVHTPQALTRNDEHP